MNKAEQRREPSRQRIAHQETSGQSIRAYCRERGLKEHDFYGGRQRLREQSAPVGFALVETKPTVETPASLELLLASGDRLRIRVRFIIPVVPVDRNSLPKDPSDVPPIFLREASGTTRVYHPLTSTTALLATLQKELCQSGSQRGSRRGPETIRIIRCGAREIWFLKLRRFPISIWYRKKSLRW